MTRPLTIAVTGLNATDNPAPGVGVLRSLAIDAPPGEIRVGLAYDALDPGVYASDLAHHVYLLPYPSSGKDAYLARLRYIHESTPLDVIIPTLDAELPLFIALLPELAAMGISVCLPSRDQLELRSKANLVELGQIAGIDVPRTMVVSNHDELMRAPLTMPYPFFIKGVFYGATLVTCYEEALAAFHQVAAVWGLPVILQTPVQGEEVNVVGLGDGAGNLLGAVAMKKLALTDKGKGWAGVTVRDRTLLDLAERFARHTQWRGPFEMEAIRDGDGRYRLIEINPRFPAWVYLASAAGVNLPRAAVELSLGRKVELPKQYDVGKVFVRISLDQIVGIADLEHIITAGEISRTGVLGAEPHSRDAA
jgi:carbamoyl-phosphate synthase large subunit